jgi:hypothetical protein
MVSADPELPNGQWHATVGQNTLTVFLASGRFAFNPLSSPPFYSHYEPIYAQTPELGSRALVGSGPSVVAGHALLQYRARRRLPE